MTATRQGLDGVGEDLARQLLLVLCREGQFSLRGGDRQQHIVENLVHERCTKYHLHGQRFALLLGERKHNNGIVVLVHDELDNLENVRLPLKRNSSSQHKWEEGL
jgi:hypothetical protein